MKPRICIVQFPGVNCEYETVMAVRACGMDASIVRWNRPSSELEDFEGFILPGGFSYQDRVRAGAVAANEDVVEVLIGLAAVGRPVIGICNGAQVLVEAGLVPGMKPGSIDLALAPNRGMGRDGYYANWVFVKAARNPKRSAATYCLEPDEVLPIPIAHSQGRFTSSDAGLFSRLEVEGQIVLRYCKSDGSAADGFPDDPNGSDRLAAAVCNGEGNVVAMMPHPERSTWLRQVPCQITSEWSVRRIRSLGSLESLESSGPGARIFDSLRKYIEERV
jgi:phosphoribosylformylglycinamidine synthase I